MNLAIFKVIGIFTFLYFIWKNLKDDYKEEDLISYGWLSLLGMLVGGRLVFGLNHWGVWNDSFLNWFLVWSHPGISYIGSYFGLLAACWWMVKSKEWKFWPFLEDISLSIIFLFAIYFSFFKSSHS